MKSVCNKIPSELNSGGFFSIPRSLALRGRILYHLSQYIMV
nr:MAG TPA: hypothetical protein [Bacteriophage sp.]